MAKGSGFTLLVPLDASGVEGVEPGQEVKVALLSSNDETRVETVKLGKEGQGRATFRFDERPGSLRVVVGPESAADDELAGLQTLTRSVSARAWRDEDRLTLATIRITPWYWYWWRRWCRTFTVRGRLVCPDGRPVPGAEVCAYDVDRFWWWCSTQQVGCGTTDANGNFEIEFRWCCGWWPWWWWRLRSWRLDPALAERIVPVLQRLPELEKIPTPGPRPDPAVFDRLLAHEGVLTRQPAPVLEPARLAVIRERLVRRLPDAPELARLRIWPWWPWRPWWDCTPDLIFRATQRCLGRETVVVDEGCDDARWNVPQTLTVTLVASADACCITDCGQECPEGDCVVITHACDDPVYAIGGNPGSPPGPDGYRNPGIVANYGDRPYGGTVSLRGQFGAAADVDYYELEWSGDGGTTWNAMPPAAAGGFTRVYYGPEVGTSDPADFHAVPFAFNAVDGRNVVESREHFEAANDPASWGSTRFWITNRDRLALWRTLNNFADGTYALRIRSWNLVGGSLTNSRILPLCDTEDDNGIILTVDNRVVGAGSGHPTASDHPCGPGTVHTCTTEPDTDVIDVRLVRGGVVLPAIGACGEVTVEPGDKLRVDFLAHDPDGHLAYYTLRAHYGENDVVNLLGLGSATLTPLAGAAVPPAAQVGPGYGAARSPAQGASAPVWAGGAMRLEVDAQEAFERTCCYLLRLRAFKRTIVSCDDDYPHRNVSEYSFMVTV